MKKILALILSLLAISALIASCNRKTPYDDPGLTIDPSHTATKDENTHIHDYSFSSAFEKGQCATCGETSEHCEVDGTYFVPLDNDPEDKFFVVVNLELSKVYFVKYVGSHSTVLSTEPVLAVNPDESLFTIPSATSADPLSITYNSEEKTISVDYPIVPSNPLQRFSDNTEKSPLPTEHFWTSATCSRRSHCIVCNLERGDLEQHKLLPADCYTPKRCSVCGQAFGIPLYHDVENGKCTRCGRSCLWETRTYVDEFGRSTGEEYVCLVERAKGKFSNTATTNSLLTVQIFADKKEVCIFLRQYGSQDVRTSYSTDYRVKMLKDNGEVMTFNGCMYSDRIRFYSSDSEKILDALQSGKTLSFYIEKRNSATTYRFDIDCSNFSEEYSKMLKSQ